MLTLDQINRMSREEKIANLRGITPDSIVRALLAYLPATFLCDPEKLHAAMQNLRKRDEYRDLLKDFEPVPAPVFEYSPLLERVLKRLQIARLLTTQSPDLRIFQISEAAKAAIADDIPRLYSDDQQQRLKEIAEALDTTLKI